MKKVKLSLDKRAVQEFFVQHAEKIILVGVVLCFLLFVYRAIGRETYPRTPQELTNNSRDAERKVQSTKPEAPGELKPGVYEKEVEKTAGQIDVKYYEHSYLWRPMVFDRPPKRDEPMYYTVEDLRGAAGYGAVKALRQTPGAGVTPGVLASGPAMPGEAIQGERWVVVTGLVPYQKQVEAYYEAFKNVAGSRQGISGAAGMPPGVEQGVGGPSGSGSGSVDVPQYAYYAVQRVEVTSPDQIVKESDWQPPESSGAANEPEDASGASKGITYASLDAIKASKPARMAMTAKWEAGRDWGGGSGLVTSVPNPTFDTGAVVSPIYLLPPTDFPLPPLIGGRALDESFAHPPEIPVMQRTQAGVFGLEGQPLVPGSPGLGEPVGPGPERSVPGSPGGSDPIFPGFERGGTPGMPGPGQPYGEMGPEGLIPGTPGFGPAGPNVGSTMQRMPDYRLFRFVDRTVEPGKRYRYRVRLVLLNPNYQQNPQLLERQELRKEPYVKTEWSEPCGVVEVPRDDRLLVLSVRPSVWVANEPTAKVALVKWIHKEGTEADKEQDKVYRGQVLNLPNQKWPETESVRRPKKEKEKKSTPGSIPGEQPLGMELRPLEGTPGGSMGTYGTPVKEPIKVDYLTEALLLDMRGGQRIDLNGQGRPPSSKDPEVNAPGEVLVLDPEGALVVRNELEDAAEYEKLEDRRNEPAPGSQFGPGMAPGMEVVPGQITDENILMGVPGGGQPGKRGSKKGKDAKKKGA